MNIGIYHHKLNIWYQSGPLYGGMKDVIVRATTRDQDEVYELAFRPPPLALNVHATYFVSIDSRNHCYRNNLTYYAMSLSLATSIGRCPSLQKSEYINFSGWREYIFKKLEEESIYGTEHQYTLLRKKCT